MNFKFQISNFKLNPIGLILNSFIQNSIEIQNSKFIIPKSGRFYDGS